MSPLPTGVPLHLIMKKNILLIATVFCMDALGHLITIRVMAKLLWRNITEQSICKPGRDM